MRSADVFYVQTGRDQDGNQTGEFTLVKNDIVYAHAKARSTLGKLRDLLNAPRTLEGQTVEMWNGDRATVQAVLDAGESVQLLVRKDDDALAVWTVNGQLKVVAFEQSPSTESEVAP